MSSERYSIMVYKKDGSLNIKATMAKAHEPLPCTPIVSHASRSDKNTMFESLRINEPGRKVSFDRKVKSRFPLAPKPLRHHLYISVKEDSRLQDLAVEEASPQTFNTRPEAIHDRADSVAEKFAASPAPQRRPAGPEIIPMPAEDDDAPPAPQDPSAKPKIISPAQDAAASPVQALASYITSTIVDDTTAPPPVQQSATIVPAASAASAPASSLLNASGAPSTSVKRRRTCDDTTIFGETALKVASEKVMVAEVQGKLRGQWWPYDSADNSWVPEKVRTVEVEKVVAVPIEEDENGRSRRKRKRTVRGG